MTKHPSPSTTDLTPAPEVSVIICTLNGASTIAETLDSLAAQTTDVTWELVVSDNGSIDSTRAVVEDHPVLGASATIVDSSDRRGLGHARNVGVAAARGRYVAFVDDDDIVDLRWLDELTRAMRSDRFAGSAMEYGALNDPATMVGRSKFQTASLGTFAGYTVVNGACGIERELWNAVGGNDESLTDSGEDFDFAIRVQNECDVTPVLAPRAIYHYRQRSGGWRSFQQGRRYGRGQVTLLVRHRPASGRADGRRALRMWWWCLSRAPFRVVSTRRAAWSRQLGLRVGRLEGSVAERRWFP